MKLKDLVSHIEYEFRIGRAGQNNVVWFSWQIGKMYIYRRLADLPKNKRTNTNNWGAGDIVTICPENTVCAEFGQDDFDPKFNCFNCEDWYMEIKGLTA